MTRPVRIVCAVAGLALLALLFGYDGETTGLTTRTRWRLGVWFSPWIATTKVSTRNEAPVVPGSSLYGDTSTTETRMELFSASWFFLVGGVALIVLARRKAPTSDAA